MTAGLRPDVPAVAERADGVGIKVQGVELIALLTERAQLVSVIHLFDRYLHDVLFLIPRLSPYPSPPHGSMLSDHCPTKRGERKAPHHAGPSAGTTLGVRVCSKSR